MTVPVTSTNENGREKAAAADCFRIEAGRFSGACQPANESDLEANESCGKIPRSRSCGKETIVGADAANLPTPRIDASTSSEPLTCHEPDLRDSDEDLIGRILNGDEVALGDVYARYEGLLHSVAKHILRDAGAVEEVLQDTFYQLWRVAASFDSARGSLGCWLLVMARNRSIDHLRRRPPAAGEEVTTTLPGSVLDIESFVASNEMARRVRAALRDLPEAQRVAMELAYFEGLTQSEIAIRTGKPLGTVKTRLKTGLASLKAHFGKSEIVNVLP